MKDARPGALWTRLSRQSAVWRQLPAIAYSASLSEETLVSLQETAVADPLHASPFVSSYKSSCVWTKF